LREQPAYRVAQNADACNLAELLAAIVGGQKMKAAQLIYRDEMASALCNDDEGDFLNDLILSV